MKIEDENEGEEGTRSGLADLSLLPLQRERQVRGWQGAQKPEAHTLALFHSKPKMLTRVGGLQQVNRGCRLLNDSGPSCVCDGLDCSRATNMKA